MIAIPIVLFVILIIFTIFMLSLIICAVVSYISYCHKVDKRKREIIENKYGKREQD